MIHPLITITGPSGSGKTTIVRELVKTGLFLEAISSTTRAPRPAERDGVDYYFRSQDEFLKLRDDGGLYECVYFHSRYYGIEKSEIDSKVQQKPTLLVVEPNGVNHIRSNYSLGPAFNVYLDVDFETCFIRMLGRGDAYHAAESRSKHDREHFLEAGRGTVWDVILPNRHKDETIREITALVGSSPRL